MVNTKLLFGSLTVAVLGAAGLVWASWNRGVTIVLRNAGSAALRDVTIHVTGCDYPVGSIPVGSTRRMLVDPTGASHVEISQRRAGGRIGGVAIDPSDPSGPHPAFLIEILNRRTDKPESFHTYATFGGGV